MATGWTIGSDEWNEHLRAGAESLGISLQRSGIDGFTAHALEMVQWNARVNLTAITDPLEVAVKHYIDSIAPVAFVPQNARLIDIGTGAGFPGVPLKILLPSLRVTLTDAVRKKVSFLKHVGRILNFEQFKVLHARVVKEKGPARIQALSGDQDGFSGRLIEGGCFDVVIARALSSLNDLLLMGLPLLARRGCLIALRGRLTRADIDSASRTLGRLLSEQERTVGSPRLTVKRYRLPFLGDERSIFATRFD